MRKILKTLLVACFTLALCATAMAAPKREVPHADAGMNWEMSMQPKPTAEELEAQRWSLILENDLGIYAYDMSSLGYVTGKDGKADTDLMQATVKTVFTNKDVLKKLQQQYDKKLKKKESVQYCTLDMRFNMKERTYTVVSMDVYTNKGRLIEQKKNKYQFVAIPEKTFAEAMYEICQEYAGQAVQQ